MGNWASSVVVVLLVPLPSSVRESLKDHWLVGNMASNSGNCTNVFIYKHVDAPGCAWYPLSLHGSLYMQRMHAQEGARRPSARLSWRSVWTKCKGGGKCTDLELERRCWGPWGRLLPWAELELQCLVSFHCARAWVPMLSFEKSREHLGNN